MAVLEPRSSLGLSDQRSWGKYILAAIIGGLATCLVISVFTPSTSLALSEFVQPGADGIFAIQARLSSDSYGLYLVDTRNQTILLYKYGGTRAKGLSLLSARSFRYDRQLLDFNAGKPSPQEVRKLIEAVSKTPLPSQAPTRWFRPNRNLLPLSPQPPSRLASDVYRGII